MMRRAAGCVFMGGFECASQRLASGVRLDLAVSTGHLEFAAQDYAGMAAHDLWLARDGFRWHEIERRPRRFDWSSARRVLAAADAAGVEVIWDLCHYGLPGYLDIESPAFVDRFAAFATAAATLVRNESRMPPRFCPINEISFWAWAGGDQGSLNPFWRGRGDALKRQLVRAALAAIAGIRQADPRAEIISAEPLIAVAPADESAAAVKAAESFHDSQYQTVDMLTGRLAPELGGHSGAVDMVGLNYYPDNQWVLGGDTIPLGHHRYRPLSDLLGECGARYGLPLLIAETGAEGGARAPWLHYISSEARLASLAGCDIRGICLYPITDYPGWANDRDCPAGLFGRVDATGRRAVDPALAQELRRQQGLWAADHTTSRAAPDALQLGALAG